jgi:thiol-disulfide isomerase/thioredoxin
MANQRKLAVARGTAARCQRALACFLAIWACLPPFAAHAAAADFAEFRGSVVYLDFWASWCAPCRQSFPWMQTMQDAYADRGLRVVAVNVDRYREDAERFLAKFNPTFEMRFDPQGELAAHFNIQGMPTGVIIDRHGALRYTHIGFRSTDDAAYEDQLRRVLAEK